MSKRQISICDRHKEDEEVRADETVRFFTAEGSYEIDLCVEHREEWEQFAADQLSWVKSARLIEANPSAPSKVRRHRSNAERIETRAVRLWAKDQGIDLGERGRVPADLRRRFKEEIGESARDRWTEIAQGKELEVTRAS